MKIIYTGGDIITMENESDNPEAVLVEDEKIIAVGDYEELRMQAPDAKITELNGNCLMPGFIDSHSHIVMAGQMSQFADLSGCESFSDIIETMNSYIEKNHIKKDGIAVGFGYDHNFLKEYRHPDTSELDKISNEIPICLMHVSGHMGCANSAMLRIAGIDENTEDPYGGKFGRKEGTNIPDGYMEENAFMSFQATLKEHLKTDAKAILKGMQKTYIKNGVTTCQDGATGMENMEILKEADKEGLLDVDVIVYPMAADNPDGFIKKYKGYINKYEGHIKMGGLKMILDGSPQGKTAWMSRPYEGMDDYCGYSFMTEENSLKAVKFAINNNMQILCHCNGDAASELFISSYEKALEVSSNPDKNNLRPMMVHCQTVRNDQLDRMVSLNMIASIFVGHVYFWGDVHLKNFGAERANHISPVADALKRGLSVNVHQDTPITPPDMFHSVWCAVNRKTREGRILGEAQKVSVYEALKAVTINGAYVYGEENVKGSIAPGKFADLIVVDKNPVKINVEELKNIKVLKTIKKGKTIYEI